MTRQDPIQFIDLNAQRLKMGQAVDTAILDVVNHGGYIMGPEVAALEKQLADFCGAKHCISCANGTDALVMILMAKNIGPGDAVFVPTFTFAATAEAVALCGATPVMVDIQPDSFNMCSKSLQQAIKVTRDNNLTPRCVISVDLFGQPADYTEIEAICAKHDVWLLADAAQSFGASYQGRDVGTIGLATATSFFPAKPLGCYGDGGACFTDDDALAQTLQSIRVHGKGTHKYDNARIGLNARLDTLQAAVLIEKLKLFPQELLDRQKVATRYNEALSDVAITPTLRADNTSSWAQYTLRIEGMDRDGVAEQLKAKGVPTAVYYPKPLHQQTAYQHFPRATNILPVAEKLAAQVLSLPMHPYMDTATQDYIINCVREVLPVMKQKANVSATAAISA